MRIKITVLFCLIFVLVNCNNIFTPLSDDTGTTAQGRLEKCKLDLNQGEYAKADNNITGALSLDSTLSEAFYLRAKLALLQNNVSIADVKNAIVIGGIGVYVDSILPLSNLSSSRKDSILQGNLKTLVALERIMSGKPSNNSSKHLDSVYKFNDLLLDYITTTTTLGIISLFNLDTNSSIDSADSIKDCRTNYCYNSTGFFLTAKDSNGVVDSVLLKKSSRKSLSYFAKAQIYADTLLKPYGTDKSSEAHLFRDRIKSTISYFVTKLPAYF